MNSEKAESSKISRYSAPVSVYLRKAAVLNEYGISGTSYEKWIRSGLISYKINGIRMVKREDLNAFIEGSASTDAAI